MVADSLHLGFTTIRNILIWGIFIIIAIMMLTFFLYLAVARNEIESAKRWVIDQVDKAGGIDDGHLVYNDSQKRGALTLAELTDRVNDKFGSRGMNNAGIMGLGPLTITYDPTSGIDYFGCPVDLTVERELIFRIGGNEVWSTILRTSNGGSNRGFMMADDKNGNSVRYELGDQYLDNNER